MTAEIKSLVEQVKSRLLPLSSAAGFLEKLVECLPRHRVEVETTPTNDIEVINKIKGEYKATGNAPSFNLAFKSTGFKAGWYYLEAALMRHNGSRDTNIHIYLGSEENKHITIPIATNLRGTVREVFYLPKNVTALSWRPTAAPGFFSQSPLLIHKITPLESSFRRVSRVLFDYWRFRNKASTRQVIWSWLSASRDLQSAYQHTAALRIKRVMSNDYAAFIALNDTPTNTDIRAMHKQVSQLPQQPIISLIMSVQAPQNEFFRAALDSVLGQIYPHWELLLVGNFAAGTQNQAIANEYHGKNAQVKIISIASEVDLASSLNSALKLAQGEFVVRLDQHNLMPFHALLFLAQEICNHPEADFIYSDDDNINDSNERFDPRFKPDWNPDLFLSHNYLGNLTLYRHKRAMELGGYQSGFAGAEDYEFFLRYLKEIPATKIRHIPKVLCHVRDISQPLTLSPERRMREEVAHQSGKRALANYFSGSGVTVEDGVAPSLYRIKHALPTPLPLVSIIIPTRDRVEILKKCIESIQQKTDYRNWEMLIVDNGSVEQETVAYFKKITDDLRIKVIRYDHPFNYSALNNFAVQHARGEILALLNNDVEVIAEDWLSEMVSHAIRPEVGAVGAKLLYSNGMVQHAGVIIGLGGVAGHAHKHLDGDDYGYCYRAVTTQNLLAVTGACLVVRKNCYQAVGGLNEANLAVAFNDTDLCLKLAAAGYRNVFTPYALLYHHESISRGHADTTGKHAQFVQEFDYMKSAWGNRLQNDPAYNLNLTLEFENFSLSQRRVEIDVSDKINDATKVDENQPIHFDATWYLEQNPDVAVSGMDPYEHYIQYGKSEGRPPKFDSEFYLTIYPDVAASGVNPREHFINFGKAEGRYSAFDRDWYLSQYPDVRRAGVDPLEHYIKHGKAEGRYPIFCAASSRNNYSEWIRKFDVLDDNTRLAMQCRMNEFSSKPLISVVLPVYNTNSVWLKEAIESVRNQIYINWELCIADDASTDPAIRPILEKFAEEDKRIKVVFRKKNGHISAASNSALKIATGEWIALLDHDDLLAEHALFWVVEAINKCPDSRMIYSDEDKIYEHGGRSNAYFKCGWNPDLFYCHNMFSHLGVYHTALVCEVGGFRLGLEGSQDYDLALRCIEKIAPTQIHHIPRILYHWRVHAESTASSSDAKPYAMIAGEKAINEHFQRIGVNARAELLSHSYRVRYALPDAKPLVSLIIPTRNGLKLLKQCVESILSKTTYSNYEILIVDNGSDDPATLRYMKELASEPRIRVIRDDRPFNYSALNNTAVKLAQGEIVGLINNDVEVISPDWLSEMVSHALRPEVGAVGAKLLYPDNTIQHGGVILGVTGIAGHSHKNLSRYQYGYFSRACVTQSLSAVTAACLIIKKKIYEEVVGLNEVHLQVAFNDVDFCLRVREVGYRNIWTPYAELYHHESATRGTEDTPEREARFAKEVIYMKHQWGETLQNDPAYSPNLTLDHEDFSLAWPPRVEGLVTPHH